MCTVVEHIYLWIWNTSLHRTANWVPMVSSTERFHCTSIWYIYNVCNGTSKCAARQTSSHPPCRGSPSSPYLLLPVLGPTCGTECPSPSQRRAVCAPPSPTAEQCLDSTDPIQPPKPPLVASDVDGVLAVVPPAELDSNGTHADAFTSQLSDLKPRP